MAACLPFAARDSLAYLGSSGLLVCDLISLQPLHQVGVGGGGGGIEVSHSGGGIVGELDDVDIGFVKMTTKLFDLPHSPRE